MGRQHLVQHCRQAGGRGAGGWAPAQQAKCLHAASGRERLPRTRAAAVVAGAARGLGDQGQREGFVQAAQLGPGGRGGGVAEHAAALRRRAGGRRAGRQAAQRLRAWTARAGGRQARQAARQHATAEQQHAAAAHKAAAAAAPLTRCGAGLAPGRHCSAACTAVGRSGQAECAGRQVHVQAGGSTAAASRSGSSSGSAQQGGRLQEAHCCCICCPAPAPPSSAARARGKRRCRPGPAGWRAPSLSWSLGC